MESYKTLLMGMLTLVVIVVGFLGIAVVLDLVTWESLLSGPLAQVLQIIAIVTVVSALIIMIQKLGKK